MPRPKHELAEVLKHHHSSLGQLVSNSWKRRTLYALEKCRTAALGGHIDRCSHAPCGRLHLSYNSCRNRHCPKCQGHLKQRWIEARTKDLLNTSYFHVVFTLPGELNALALRYPKQVYDSLFKVSWRVIRDFGANPKFLGAQTGMIAVLHTWGQNLSLHPHLHCIVPSGGLTKRGKWKPTKSKGKYLYPVKAMSKVFRARFVEELSKTIYLKSALRKEVFSKNWVVYAKQPFYGPRQVIEYLGRYTHKIAISNHRLLSVDADQVLFKAKDYKKGGKPVQLTLGTKEFIRRFSLHILPKGYTRMRHYGILSSSTKKNNKEKVDGQLGAVKQQTHAVESSPHRLCPSCKKGQLETVCRFDSRGPPQRWISRLKNQSQVIA